jgi:hypothetical protein
MVLLEFGPLPSAISGRSSSDETRYSSAFAKASSINPSVLGSQLEDGMIPRHRPTFCF